jgi:hypothetical protein
VPMPRTQADGGYDSGEASEPQLDFGDGDECAGFFHLVGLRSCIWIVSSTRLKDVWIIHQGSEAIPGGSLLPVVLPGPTRRRIPVRDCAPSAEVAARSGPDARLHLLCDALAGLT